MNGSFSLINKIALKSNARELYVVDNVDKLIFIKKNMLNQLQIMNFGILIN